MAGDCDFLQRIVTSDLDACRKRMIDGGWLQTVIIDENASDAQRRALTLQELPAHPGLTLMGLVHLEEVHDERFKPA